MRRLELWGGHECTVNRVRSRYLDQSVISGHQDRLSDLDLFADLGLKSLRYPVLWEKVAPERPDAQDFTWAEERLPHILGLGMRPIVGLTHHGSGPRYTSLIDDEGFAPGLAMHARATAERFPWVEDWTPVNEPLTTARFSALYGLWYPHTRNEGAFWRALLNQVDATRLSMREIRALNPKARLIQTEDLGYCHATAPMRAQADYENARRWITWDLLCGMVTPDHPLFARIAAWGLEERLRAIADDPCPPDVLGVNHYLSSERLLDHRVELYPDSLRGGDGPGPYVNIEALRTVREGPLGIGTLLKQTYERYGRQIAVTECHNGCTREEQMRWFEEVWRSVEAVRAEGVPVLAVTAWGLLGSYDWNRLLTEEAGHYEVGIFDLRSGEPQPTTMVDLLKTLAHGGAPQAPVLGGAGWWRREDRFFEQALSLEEPCPRTPLVDVNGAAARPILIAGAGCPTAEAIRDALALRNLPHVDLRVSACAEDVGEEMARLISEAQPWAVINLAGSRPAGAQVARLAQDRGLPLVTWGGGADREPAANEIVLQTPELIGRHDLHEFARHVVETVEGGGVFRAAANRTAPAGYLPDAVHAVLDLLVDGKSGRFRLAPPQSSTWAELATYIAGEAGLDIYKVEPVVVPHIGRAQPSAEPQAAGGLALTLPGLENAARRAVAGWRLVSAGRSACALEPSEEAGLRHAAE
ncbi:family 1 glycosylhydrolase [Phenylobacterium deserti]|uniref:dTDP-4-dehydrorhamnose reductase n=1 Tax=Phenylobacterium deserti TaxID=1914756 RepID=A0A328ADZ7_9CAUL|nr:family 1 glycosylhydrolase [Phenylobacterium deserti]RAK50978.1 dTDP-4-dehydrorhamnose reductase [Phenylobacterium deserti]